MAAYATVADVQARMIRTMSEDEQVVCASLLDDAAVIIDAYAADTATEEAKQVVSIRMVVRALGDGSDSGAPVGATQGSMSALGYSQSWTISSGSVGEVYLGRVEKKLLGSGNAIGSRSPAQDLVVRFK